MSLCSQPALPSQPWVSSQVPGKEGCFQTGNMSPGPAPQLPPQVLPCPPPPTPTPGMVLSSADQDFMVQKPPEGRGRRGHWRPPPPARLAALFLCAVGGAGPRRDGAHPAKRRAAAPFTFLIKTRSQDSPCPSHGAGRAPEATGGSRVRRLTSGRVTVRSVCGKGSQGPGPGLKLPHQDHSVA